mgnify:FL=1
MNLEEKILERLKNAYRGEEYFKTIKLILKFYKSSSLTKKYPGSSAKKIKIKCKNKHIRTKVVGDLVTGFNKKRKFICLDCYADSMRQDISFYQKIAKLRGGKLLSKKYFRAGDKGYFECKFGHRWRPQYNYIRIGGWCPTCSSGLGERLTRIAFNTIINKKFIKFYPEWLISPEKTNLELDGYNKELKLAFEHQGQQNFNNLKKFFNKKYKGSKAHIRYLKNAKLKEKLCAKNNVKLIKIPEVPTITKIDDLKYLIAKKLKNTKNNYIKKRISKINEIKINYNPAYKFNHLETMSKIAKSRGGRIISKYFLGHHTKLKFKCKYNHSFSMDFTHLVYRRQWCDKKKCLEETKIIKLIERNPSEKKLILSAKSSDQAKMWVAKKKNPNFITGSNNAKTIRSHPLRLKHLKKLLKKKNAKLLTKITLLQSRTRIEIKCKRNGPPFNHPIYDTSVMNILNKKRWCKYCGRYELHN